ncbi:MAG: hypothetical protein WD278_04125 [Pirellulales bacterium]
MASKEREALELAKKHYAVEEGVTDIFVIKDSVTVEVVNGEETIKLLEVNANTVPSGIVPIQFAPAPAFGINYPSVILEVTPEEYERIKTKELVLPNGWEVGELIPRPLDGAGK